MYFLLKMGVIPCYVSFPEGTVDRGLASAVSHLYAACLHIFILHIITVTLYSLKMFEVRIPQRYFEMVLLTGHLWILQYEMLMPTGHPRGWKHIQEIPKVFREP